MITHANLADNLQLIVTGLSAVNDTVVVGWLPQVTEDLSYDVIRLGSETPARDYHAVRDWRSRQDL